MPENQELQRAVLLLQHERNAEAKKLLNDGLARDPESAEMLSLLALAELGLGNPEAALQAADAALAKDPSSGLYHLRRGEALMELDRLDEAVQCFREARQRAPYDGQAPAHLAAVAFRQRRFKEALDLAEQALELEPELQQAQNIRNLCLVKLNRREQADAGMEDALRQSPNDAQAHAVSGWGNLERRRHQEALQHFAEALRLNPNLDLARAGMQEALKSRYAVYRAYMRFQFWMANQARGVRIAVVFGSFILLRILRGLERSIDGTQWWLVVPILVLATLFLSTWLFGPVGDVYLLTNRYGKHLLSDAERKNAHLGAGSMVLMLLGVVLAVLLPGQTGLALLGIGLCMLIMTHEFYTAERRSLVQGYVGIMAVLGAGVVAGAILQASWMGALVGAFVLGFVGFTWGFNALAMSRPD